MINYQNTYNLKKQRMWASTGICKITKPLANIKLCFKICNYKYAKLENVRPCKIDDF